MAAKRVKTGGRKAGTPNKASNGVREAAQGYTTEAVDTLASIMRKSDNDAARVSAIKELIDRGHGKAAQPITGGGPDDPPVRIVVATGIDRAPNAA